MTRPALIIGLGGTGQWVLTYLKKDLIESNNGVMPDNVELLAFDTMPQASVSADSASSGGGQEKKVEVGSIRLETDKEFIHLGGDMYRIGEAVLAGRKSGRQDLPHIASWFAAEHWMPTLPRAAWVLSSGAGQLRQFGRLGLFRDLSDPNRSAVWSRLDVAITRLSRKLGGQKLEIIVVGSFAGGTGSGMFIDIGLLARERARSVPNLVRGYFCLPRVFDSEPDEDMKARSFAAWRELNRFMTVSPDFSMPALVYNPMDGRLQIKEIKNKVYDACYLIDGKQGEVRVDAEPEKKIFPSIADAISALLDETSGSAYTEWVVSNLAPVYAANPGIPLFSAVGSHSYKIPIYYSQQEFSHKLTTSLLDHLVRPLRDDPANPRRITGVSPTSPYNPVNIGQNDSFDLFLKDYAYEGQSEQATLFTRRVTQILNDGGASNDALVAAYAVGTADMTKGGKGKSWLQDFTDFGDRAAIRALTTEIKKWAQLKLIDSIKLSRDLNEDPRSAPRRFQQGIPAFFRNNYGGRGADGVEFGGKFGEALDQAVALQLDILKRNTRLWLMYTLMGSDPNDPIKGRSGRVGYAYDLLNGLVDRFSQFLQFMEAVDEKRRGGQESPRLRYSAERNQQNAEMNKWAPVRLLGLTPHPKAHASQIPYLEAEQKLIDVRKDEQLHQSVETTARQMQAHVVEIRDELARWIQLLATGDPATGVSGLYPTLAEHELEIRNTAQADANLAAQTMLTGPQYLEDKVELGRLMKAVTWRIDPAGDRFALSLAIESAEEGTTQLERPTGRERPEVRASLTQRNLASVLSYAQRRFSQLPGETRVAQRLAEQYGYSAEDFVKDLGQQAEPYFAKHPHMPGGSAKWAKLIRISMDKDKLEPRTFAFVQEIQDELRRKSGVAVEVKDQDKLVQIVGSSDSHKCTAVFTDDLYQVELFEAWEDCMNAYLTNRKYPPHLNHNFPAEAMAARYELELAQRRHLNYRVFHPWVVMLMEHENRAKMFFVARALGWIKLATDEADTWYELRLPEWPRALMLTPKSSTAPSLFRVMRYFSLVGMDQALRSSWAIDYAEVQKAISAEERTLGNENWVRFLEDQTEKADRQVLVPWIMRRVAELDACKKGGEGLPPDEPADYEQAYEDLAAVAGLMFEKRIEEKRQQATALKQ